MRPTVLIALAAALCIPAALASCSPSAAEGGGAERGPDPLDSICDRLPREEAAPRRESVLVQAWGASGAEAADEAASMLSEMGVSATAIADAGYADPASRTLVVARDEGMLARAEEVAEMLGAPRSRVVLGGGGYDFDADMLVLIGSDFAGRSPDDGIEGAEPGSGGGAYSHHWEESGKVDSVSEGALTLRTEDGRILTVDTTRAERRWHYPPEVDEGDEIVVMYFLYDRAGDEIVAESVESKCRTGSRP